MAEQSQIGNEEEFRKIITDNTPGTDNGAPFDVWSFQVFGKRSHTHSSGKSGQPYGCSSL